MRRTLLEANRGRGAWDLAKTVSGLRPGHFGIETPSNGEPRTGLTMGDHMAITAKAWGITREAKTNSPSARTRTGGGIRARVL